MGLQEYAKRTAVGDLIEALAFQPAAGSDPPEAHEMAPRVPSVFNLDQSEMILGTLAAIDSMALDIAALEAKVDNAIESQRMIVARIEAIGSVLGLPPMR